MTVAHTPNRPSVLAMDIGGTHFRMGLCSPEGKLLVHQRLDTASIKDPREALSMLASQVDPHSEAATAVAGVPGVVDHDTGTILHAPNLPADFVPRLSAAAIAQAVGRPARIVNDADLAAIGEAYLGAAAGKPSMSYVTISTGIGAGVVIRGRLLHGTLSLAELGHSFIFAGQATPEGAGSVEWAASGTALHRQAEAEGLDLGNPEIVRAAVEGTEPEASLLGAVISAAAVAVANMAHLFSTEIIVLGGGLSLADKSIIARIADKAVSLAPPYLSLQIVPAALGDDAALVGASRAADALD